MHAIPQLWKIGRKHKESDDKMQLQLPEEAILGIDGGSAAVPSSIKQLMMLQAKSSSSSASMKMNNDAGAKSTVKKKQQMQRSSSVPGNRRRNNDNLQRRVVSVVDAGCTCRATVTTSTSSYQNSIQVRQTRPTSAAALQPKSNSSYDMIGGIVCKSTQGNGGGVASSGKISASTLPPKRLSIQPAESLQLQWRPPRNAAGLEVDAAAATEARGLHDSLRKKNTTGKISGESSCSLSSSVNRNSNSISSGIGIVGDGSSSSAAGETEELMQRQQDTESTVAAASMAAASRGCRRNGNGTSAATPPLPSLPELLREYVATKTKYRPAGAAPESHNLACFRGFEFSSAGRRTDFDREVQGSGSGGGGHSFRIENYGRQELETVPDERSLPLETSDRWMFANTGKTQIRKGRCSMSASSIDDVEEFGGVDEMNADFIGGMNRAAGRRSVDAVAPPPPTLSIRRRSRNGEAADLPRLSRTWDATESTQHECRVGGSCSDYGDDEASSSSSVGKGEEDEEEEAEGGGGGGGGAMAIVKSSVDPVHDFKQSMAEMVAAEQLSGEAQLQELLQCYLCLNSRRYHGAIVRAFRELCCGASAAGEPPL